MGLLDFASKKHKDLEQLEKDVYRNPSAHAFCNLVKKYWEAGLKDKAVLIAQEATSRFVESDEVFELYSRIRKEQIQNEIEALKKIVEEHPTPAAFAQLAEIYKDLRDEESALKYCRQAIEKFPNDDSPYRIIGELRLRRFYKDFLVKDGQMTIENLEKAYEINNKNYKALLALAKLYLQIGALTKARQRLRSILLFAPEDEAVKKLLEKGNKMAKPSHEDVDILLQMVEEKKGIMVELEEGHGTSQGQELAVPDPDVFLRPLETVKQTEGLQCVIVCDREGTLIAHYAKGGVDYQIYYEVATSIYQTVQDSSRQMDIGRFQRCMIEGPFGSLHLIGSEGVVYMGFGKKDIKADIIYKHLQKLISMVSHQISQGTKA